MAPKSTDGIRKTPSLARTQRDIASIFKQEGGRVDMTRLERKKRNPRKTMYIILLVAAVLLVVAAAGFYFFLSKDKEFSGESIDMQTSAPGRIATGEDFPLTLTFTNTEQVALNDLEVTLQFPDGYTIKSASKSAENEAKNAFAFGTLAPGAQNSLTVTGNLVGAIGAQKDFGVTFTFRPSNFNYQFSESKTTTVRIATSALVLDIDGPQELPPETVGTWTVKVTNTSSDALRALRFTLVEPDGFTLTTSDPALSDDKRWSVDALEPDEDKTLTFSGKFADTDQEFVQLALNASINRNGVEDGQGSATFMVLLVKPQLFITLNRGTEQSDAPVKPGDRIPVIMAYENASELALSDVRLSVTVDDASPVVMTDIESTPIPAQDGRTLTWTQEQFADLAQIRPGAKGSVEFTLTVPATIVPESADDVNQNIILRARPEIGSISDVENTVQPTEDTVLTIPVSTVLAVSGEARYYSAEGVQIGAGPLPPQAGSATTYIIQWFANNTTNDVEDFSVVATIPKSVFWTGADVKTSAGTITFDPVSREVQWRMDVLPSGSGSLSATLTAQFSVRITPGTNDVGSTPVLVDAAQVQGTDSHTQETVGGSIATMTTDLLHDTQAGGQGTVVLGE